MRLTTLGTDRGMKEEKVDGINPEWEYLSGVRLIATRSKLHSLNTVPSRLTSFFSVTLPAILTLSSAPVQSADLPVGELAITSAFRVLPSFLIPLVPLAWWRCTAPVSLSFSRNATLQLLPEQTCSRHLKCSLGLAKVFSSPIRGDVVPLTKPLMGIVVRRELACSC